MDNILILGGTRFIGRCLVEQLIGTGKYNLTLSNRGVTNTTLFPDIQNIKGDRYSEGYGQLIAGDWDYIIDVSCYYPNSLEEILPLVSPKLKKYIFVSTVSLYEPKEISLKDETAEIKHGDEKDWADTTWATYGERKVRCEELIQSAGINYTILRSSLVYGKYDHTDRFYYWMHQVKKYDEILIPNDGTQKISLVYVYDLVRTIIQSISPKENREIYNVVSLPEVSISEIVEATSQLLRKSPRLVFVPADYLHEKNISQWGDMPLWIDNDYYTYDNKKIVADSNYNFKPTDLSTCIKETIEYFDALGWQTPQYGIDRNQQLDLMENYTEKV